MVSIGVISFTEQNPDGEAPQNATAARKSQPRRFPQFAQVPFASIIKVEYLLMSTRPMKVLHAPSCLSC